VARHSRAIYRDRRGEIPEGKEPWWQLPVFNFCDGYLTVNVGGTYVRSAQRFEELPRHSEALKEALTLCSDLCNELSYDMEFVQGDVQILHNHVTCHSRTEFEDYPERTAAAAEVPRPLRPS
jgi:alpha-ketoglutarate-dependent taurine dioxygenase